MAQLMEKKGEQALQPGELELVGELGVFIDVLGTVTLKTPGANR